MLVYLPQLHPSAGAVRDAGKSNATCALSSNAEDLGDKRLRSETARLPLWIVPDIFFFLSLPLVCAAFTHLNLNFVPRACVEAQRKTFGMHL